MINICRFALIIMFSILIYVNGNVAYSKDKKIVSLPLNFIFGSLSFHLYYSHNNYSFPLELDLVNPFMWLSNAYMKPHKIEPNTIYSSNQTIKLKISEIPCEAIPMSTDFLVKSNPIVNIYSFPFMCVSFLQEGQYESLGLAHGVQNVSLSFVHELFRNGYINHNGFSIDAINLPDESYIHFGGISQYIRDNYRYMYNCDVNKSSLLWQCNIKGISLNHKLLQTTAPSSITTPFVYFTSNNTRFKVPEQIFQEIYLTINTWFNSENNNMTDKEKHKCKFTRFDRVMYFSCSCSYINFENVLEFGIVLKNDVTLIFKDNELLRSIAGFCYIEIQNNNNMNDDTSYQIGISLYHKYPVYFSYDEHKVYFYSNDSLLNENNKYYKDEHITTYHTSNARYTFIITLSFIEIIFTIYLLLLFKMKNVN